MRLARFRTAIIVAALLVGFAALGGVGASTSPASSSASSPASSASTPAPALAATTPMAVSTAHPLATPSKTPAPTPSGEETGLPRPDHVVIVVEEDHSSADQDPANAPYLATLARRGANFTEAYALSHASQPNYLALFSGSMHDISDDSCPHTLSGPNLASELLAVGRSFVGYAEGLPSDGYTGCEHDTFARAHAPWMNFPNVPKSSSLRFKHFPSSGFRSLPTVSMVIPDLCHDMHDCPAATGDAWLKSNLGAYASWAKTHNSLLIVTFDEPAKGADNRIPLIMYGEAVRPGDYRARVDHYTVLRTIEDMYGLACTGNACRTSPITTAFRAASS